MVGCRIERGAFCAPLSITTYKSTISLWQIQMKYAQKAQRPYYIWMRRWTEVSARTKTKICECVVSKKGFLKEVIPLVVE